MSMDSANAACPFGYLFRSPNLNIGKGSVVHVLLLVVLELAAQPLGLGPRQTELHRQEDILEVLKEIFCEKMNTLK